MECKVKHFSYKDYFLSRYDKEGGGEKGGWYFGGMRQANSLGLLEYLRILDGRQLKRVNCTFLTEEGKHLYEKK